MKNKELANLFYEISELLSLGEENLFRIRAYNRAGQVIEALPESIEDIVREDRLKEIPGIGESMAGKIKEYLATGRISYLETLRKGFPQGILEIMSVAGMGPKKAKILYDKLHIGTVDELAGAARQGKLRRIRGFGAKSEENILQGIALKEQSKGRILLNEATIIANELMGKMSSNKSIREISTAGSLKRYRETIGDIDILCAVDKGREGPVIDQFTHLPQVKRVIALGGTKISVLLESDIQVDLRIIEPNVYGAALQYFTGSKSHNVSLRTLAKQRGLTISEYGVFRIGKKRKPLVAKREEDVYDILGMQFIPAPMRENRGEIEAALKGKIPRLLERKDIKGDIHVHSRYSDGADTIAAIARKAQDMGYEWIIITDHSPVLKVAHGLNLTRLRHKMEEIRKLNQKNKDFTILCGTEVDILNDGGIDYPDRVLEELDFVLASIHSGFKQSEEQMTRRIVKALEHPLVHCIGHPSGRLLKEREPYAVNMDKVLEAAKQHRKLLEINVFPDRLDLTDIYCKRAKDMGITMALGTDSHSLEHLGYMDIGVHWAQRGWLEKRNVINTLSYDELVKHLTAGRRETVDGETVAIT